MGLSCLTTHAKRLSQRFSSAYSCGCATALELIFSMSILFVLVPSNMLVVLLVEVLCLMTATTDTLWLTAVAGC